MVQGVKSSEVIACSGLVLQEQILLREAQGLVRGQRHPRLPLTIYNYTEKCQYDRLWDDVLLQCRGLVLHDNGQVAARPFRKFFNDTEIPASEIPWELPHEITEKLDGSLLIVFFACGEWVFATRGSFTSEQAIRGEEIFHANYGSPQVVGLHEKVTYLFEVIYPENRVVVNYGSMADTVLLGMILTSSGMELRHSLAPYGVPVVKRLIASLGDVTDFQQIRRLIADDREGYVVRFSNGLRVKVKGENYIRLHSAMSGLSTRKVWECLRDNGRIEPLLEILPDEMQMWVIEVTADLCSRFIQIADRVKLVVDSVRGLPSRKEQAAWILANAADIRGACFSALDSKDYQQAIWRLVEPEFERPHFGPLRSCNTTPTPPVSSPPSSSQPESPHPAPVNPARPHVPTQSHETKPSGSKSLAEHHRPEI